MKTLLEYIITKKNANPSSIDARTHKEITEELDGLCERLIIISDDNCI